MALPLHASPSEMEAQGTYGLLRRQTIKLGLDGDLSARVCPGRHYMRVPGRIVAITSFRRTGDAGGGAGGNTTTRVLLNGSTVQAAVATHPHGTDNDVQTPALLTSHAAYEAASGGSIVLAPGDYLEVEIVAIETGATAPKDLTVEIEIAVG